MAVSVREIDKRIHWLEAAARWLSLYCQAKVNRGPHGHRAVLQAYAPLSNLTAHSGSFRTFVARLVVITSRFLPARPARPNRPINPSHPQSKSRSTAR